MAGRPFSVRSLPVVAALLAVLALGLIVLGRYLGLGVDTFFLLAVPILLAVAYLAWYRTLPYEPLRPAPPPAVAGDEPFEDPVEEADRIEGARDDVDAIEDPLEPS